MREDHIPVSDRNLHGTSGVEWRLLARDPPSFARMRKDARALSEVMGQAYNTKLQMRGQFLLI
jgi:hypothetical protein